MRDTVGSAESGGNPPADAADIRRTVLIRYEPSTRSTYHERPNRYELNRYELKPGKIVTPSPAHPLGAVKPLDVPSASYELNPWDVPETGST